MSESGKALLLIAIVVCLVLMVQPDAMSALLKRKAPVPKRVLSEAEMQLFTVTANTGEIVMVGAQGVLLDQGQQAVRVGTSDITLITAGSERVRVNSSGNVGIGTNSPIGHLHVSSNGSNSTLYVGKAITSNGEYKDSYFIRPSADINNHAGLPSTYNYGGGVLLQSSNLYHNTWSAWNEAGALRLIAGSVYSRGNSGNAPGGHEIGGDVLIDSGAVVKRTDGGAGPYGRGGNIFFRTGNVYNVSSEAAVNTYPVDYTTRMYISGENGSVGVGTTWTSKHHPITMETSMHIKPITITVGGNINTWYKVKISSVTYNMCKFSITRGIHQDQQERGSMALDVEFRSSNCGNQSAHIAYKYNQFSYGPYFVARVSVDEAPDNYCSHTCCYVYLLGSCSYYFSGMNCYIEYNSPDGTSPGTINSLTTRDIPFSTGEQILSHDSRTAISSVLGNVGIGTLNPYRPLMVNGAGQIWATPTRYFDIGTGNLAYNADSIGNIAIAALGSIVAGGAIAAYSDERIKANIRPISYSISDLLALQPVEYTHIDTIKNSGKNQLGFIAQQVKNVCPEVVDDTEISYIPDVYRVEKVIQQSGKSILVSLSKEVSWKAGDKVQIISREKPIEGCSVLEISPSQCLIELPTEESISPEVFLYGKKVEDFHTIDYGKITALLVKCAQDQYHIMSSLSDRLSRLEALLSR